MNRINTALGYEVKKHPELKEQIIQEFSLTEKDYNKLKDGRLHLIYPDLKRLCSILNLPIDRDFFKLLEESYIITSKKEGFEKPENYDKILTIINEYIDLKECLDKE